MNARPTETAVHVNGLMFTFVYVQELQKISIFLPKTQKKGGETADNKSTDWTLQPLFRPGLIDCTKEKDTEKGR